MHKSNALTEKQIAMLRYIAEYAKKHQFPTTIREIQEELSISSSSVVTFHLNNLEDMGLITRMFHTPRSIVLTAKGKALLSAEKAKAV